MQASPNNPKRNGLPTGLSEDQLNAAIRSSGYPLQSRVVGELAPWFASVQQEWAYIDRDTTTYRTLDVLATRQLWRLPDKRRFRISLHARPSLALLIECIQASLPYVFFQSAPLPDERSQPLVAGLRHSQVELSAKGTQDKFVYDIPHAIGLKSLPFISEPPTRCHTFSSVARKGSGVELTGSDAFNRIVQPLVKAGLHFETISMPRSSFRYLECFAVVLVAVLDAPMVIVEVTAGDHTASLAPWIRVFRSEPVPGAQTFDTHKAFAIDCVHGEYLPTYLANHLIPFASEFGTRVERHHNELYHGRGNLSSERASWRENPEPYLTFKG